MIFKLLAAAGRYRRVVLVTGAVLVTGMVLAWPLGADRETVVLGPVVLMVLIVVGTVLTFLAPSTRRPPAAFVVSEAGRAFRTPRTVMWSLIAVAHLALIGVLALYPDEFLSGGLKDAVVEVLGVAVFCLVVAGGAIAGDVWVSERLGDDSLVHVVAGAIAVAAGMLLIEAVKDFRKA